MSTYHSYRCSGLNCLSARRGHSNVLNLGMTIAIVFLSQGLLWASNSHKQHGRKKAPPDPGYASALAAANRFLHAWATGDLETGMVLLSNRVRHAQNPDVFETLFSVESGRGFEIARGAGSRGRYRFPVVLVTTRGSQICRKASDIILIDTGKNDWAVDKLP
ncbi:MAG TPA: hypothetical protein VLT90_01575 [Terriglobales bacterium]|nr:hypothetical protein [Terriglobales bacterium]